MKWMQADKEPGMSVYLYGIRINIYLPRIWIGVYIQLMPRYPTVRKRELEIDHNLKVFKWKIIQRVIYGIRGGGIGGIE